ncbi:NAD-dependent epimerase/dehydratase family protein [Patescibacteria group bacterium]|nr:NAD-dependent epimerase/dehydratase family protein [Patescibacteria group bacterium]
MTDKKTALVTGGAGFVGSHLCERLHTLGYRVISLDNYFTGSPDNHVAGVEYRNGHTKDIEKHVPEKIDIIYHLGEYSRVEQSVLEPDIVHDLNTLGTKGVVVFWQKRKCKLVYAGSSTKFGDDGAARHTSPYASTKAENSEFVRDVGEKEKLPYAITYFYNVYGPRERSGVYGTVIEHFKRMYLAGTPCAVVSPGTQERNFTHVDDIVDGLIKVGEKGQGDEYGLGNTRAYSIFTVADLFGFGENIVMFPERSGNRLTSGLDVTKSRAVGWDAQRELPQYINDFTRTHTQGTAREKRILVFSTTMHPVAGLAEDALLSLAQALPDVSFDVITSRFIQHPGVSPAHNITLYHVGFGSVFDKFLLPILGPLKALSLWKKGRYLFAWSLMASYAALAGIIFKSFTRAPLLITLADQTLDDLPLLQRVSLSVMLSRADQVYGTHGTQEKAAMRSSGTVLPRNTLGEGDSFANALRFAYADMVRKLQKLTEAKKKKVLLFSLAYFPRHVGGAEVAIKEITDRIDPNAYEFDLITLKFESDEPNEEVIGNVRVHRVGWGGNYISKVFFVLHAAAKALSLHRVRRFDRAWAMMSYMLFPIVIARFLGMRIPYILSLQEGDPFEHVFRRPHVALLSPLLRYGFEHARAVQAISTYLSNWAHTMGFTGEVAVVPNGTDTKAMKSRTQSTVHEIEHRLKKKAGDIFLVTASRLVKKNAVDDVIRALRVLPPTISFVVIGDGPDGDALKKLAHELGVEKRVQFLGFVPQPEVGDYLKASDIFIRPSRSEGMGNSFIEAMAVGLPVIGTQEGGIADFLFDEKRNPDMPTTGWAVDKNSPQDIARVVMNIIEYPDKTQNVVTTARAMVEEKYDWDLISDKIRAILEK